MKPVEVTFKNTWTRDLIEEIDSLFSGTNSDVNNENANKDAVVIATKRDLLAGIVSKSFALNKLLPEHIAEAHISGDIHFHDLDYSPLGSYFNCMVVDIPEMFKGFTMGSAEVETPKSIATAMNLVAQIVANVASNTYGGTTIQQLDEIMVPYVRASYNKYLSLFLRVYEGDEKKAAIMAEELTEKETLDACQSLEYELNTIYSSNGQTPFVTINFGLGTSWEARLVQKGILKTRIGGLGRTKKTAVFPKLVFTIKKGVNHEAGEPNYDIKQLALECASKRMYPDILNYDKLVETTGDFKAPMGCRSFLSANGYESNMGRNNMGVVSVNIPRIAIEANGDINKFWEILDKRCELAKEALDVRIDRLRTVKAKEAPILYMHGALGVRLKPEDNVFQIFENGRASVSMGYIGLHEAANAMFGEEEHTVESKKKTDFTIAVVERLRYFTDKWKKDTGLGYGLYSTPSESLCDRFCKLDIKKFGDVKGVTDKEYYTNSFHQCVHKKTTPFEKIDFEMQYPQYTAGGFISYVEFPNMKNNLKGLESIWDYTYDKLPYFGTNTPVDYCGECDFSGESKATSEGFECPHCGNNNPLTLSVTRRVCGYLGNPGARPYCHGKQQEVMGRVKHLTPMGKID